MGVEVRNGARRLLELALHMSVGKRVLCLSPKRMKGLCNASSPLEMGRGSVSHKAPGRLLMRRSLSGESLSKCFVGEVACRYKDFFLWKLDPCVFKLISHQRL